MKIAPDERIQQLIDEFSQIVDVEIWRKSKSKNRLEIQYYIHLEGLWEYLDTDTTNSFKDYIETLNMIFKYVDTLSQHFESKVKYEETNHILTYPRLELDRDYEKRIQYLKKIEKESKKKRNTTKAQDKKLLKELIARHPEMARELLK